MFKIKLLILLLLNSFFFISCTKEKIQRSEAYRIGKIVNGEEGVILYNYLYTYLKSSEIYNINSNLVITPKINHSKNLYLTNVNNTSDRERIITDLKIIIYDLKNDCELYNYEDQEEGFYVITSTQNYLSNNKAVEEIKDRNTEILINNFINHLIFKVVDMNCINEQQYK